MNLEGGIWEPSFPSCMPDLCPAKQMPVPALHAAKGCPYIVVILVTELRALQISVPALHAEIDCSTQMSFRH